MKFYVASKFENKKRVREAIEMLEGKGHRITYDWTNATEFVEDQALRDCQGVLNADAIVGIFEDDVKYQGALMEIGIAIGIGIDIYIIGEVLNNCIFILLPKVKKISFEELENL